MSTTLKVWVGCLACYNNGNLTGEWVDASDAPEWECANPTHEETWCFDHDAAPWIEGECSPMHAAEVQEALDTIPEDMSDAVMAYCDNMSEDVLTVDVSRVEEAFAGEWESWDDYVSNYVEDTGMLSEVPEDVKRYFDYDSFGSDLMYDYWTADTRDGIMVFHSL